MANITHLHTHSDASLKDGLRPVSALVQVAANKGFKHLALTDHGSLANAIAFTLECQTVGIKPIIGVEGYIAFDGEKNGHITLLADGNKGFTNLVKLNNLGHASSHKHPAFTVDQLIAHADGLVLLTGCVASPLNQLPLGDAIKLGARLKSAFGARMFAEVMFASDLDSHTRPLELADRLGLKVVITNDAHFPSREDAPVHPILTQMKAGYDYNSQHLYLRTADEIMVAATKFVSKEQAAEWIGRSVSIGEKIGQVNFKREPRLPEIEDADKKLRTMVLGGHPLPPEYTARAQYELDIIQRMGYSTYFLILKDIVEYSRASGVRVGPGRGSGAGSLVLNLLGITEINPLQYDLPFERFLNPERIGMPDVDTDFDSEMRHVVIDYAKKKWGGLPIAIYSRYSHKVLVHDLSKSFHVPRELDSKAADEGPESAAFREITEKFDGFSRAYEAINGQIRHKGKHAGGVIITDQEVPIERTGDSLAASWTEGLHNELSYAGIVKYDLLGLSALSVLKRLEAKFGRHADKPADGSPVFSLFWKGKLEGIFQFSGSAGIRELTLQLHPTKFEDLVAINALYRPGALDVGATARYPEWKKKPRKIHPLIDDILTPTYGAIVYQEQVMSIFARVTGGTLGSADAARRVIVKSKEHDMEWLKKFMDLKSTFVHGCIEKGMMPDAAEKLWDELAAHSRYSFNKAHSVSYAMISWEMAWWKHYHTSDFYAALLNVDQAESQTYLVAAVDDGCTLQIPDVNHSGREYVADGKMIYMPLTAIKYLSDTAAAEIIAAREKGVPFKSGEDFMKRTTKKVVRAQARKGLLMTGAFGSVPVTPESLAVDADIPDIDATAVQREYLGVVLPTKEALDKVRRAKEAGEIAGIVASIEEKSSRYGIYHVFKLVPSGVFWTRGLSITAELQIGDCVSAVVRGETGKATKVKKL